MKVPVNTLYPTPLTVVPEWSGGRWRMFARCRREFCFHYLAARGGWDMEMPEILRQLYRLKRLATIERVTVDILRCTAEELSACSWKSGGNYAAAFLRSGSRAVSARLRKIADMAFYNDPAMTDGLQELDLDRMDFDEAAASLHESFSRAAERFLAEYQEILAANDPADWIRQEQVEEFSFDGVNIYLRGAPVWMKNGKAFWLELCGNGLAAANSPGSDEWRRYWIYRRYKTDPGRISILFYDLPTGRTYCRDGSDFDFTGARELMYKEAAVMMDWVREAVSENFDVMETRPEPGTDCGKCRFRDFCRSNERMER